VAAAVAATLLVVAWGYWRGSRHEVKLLPPRNLPAHAEQQLSGYSFTRSMGGRRIFTVHAAKSVAFDQGGATVLEDVWVELFGAQDTRHDILGTHQCKYNPQTGALTADGIRMRVTDTQKKAGDVFAHSVAVEEGTVKLGSALALEVDHARRMRGRLLSPSAAW